MPIFKAVKGFVWLQEFYDNNISSVVEKLYYAVSMHDRLSVFKPYLVNQDPKHKEDKALQIYKWFPSTHYNLGR